MNGFNIIMHSGGVSRKIEVDEGEYLMLTSGVTITSSQPYWDGIKALGKSMVSQFDLSSANNIPEYVEAFNSGTVYNTNQTMLIMESGSKIYKALTALHSTNGAILIADNSTIQHCKIGVKIENYIHPTSSIKENLEYRNASYLNEMFVLVDNIIDGSADYSNYRSISLHGVHGIHIQATQIRNDQGLTFPLTTCLSLGIGIYSYNSSFSLHKGGTAVYYESSGCYDYSGQKSQIQKFSYGIYSEESSTPPAVRAKFAVQENDFRANLISVSALRGSDYLFKDNTVEIQTAPNWAVNYNCPIIAKGLSFTDIGSFGVVNNSFYPKVGLGTSSTHTPSIYMLEVDNGGSAANKIQNNHFWSIGMYNYYGIDETGIRMRGDNENIEPWCSNRFDKLHYGIYIEDGTPNEFWLRPGDGILKNTFANNSGTDLVNNSLIDIKYCELPTPWSTFSKSGQWILKQHQDEGDCPLLSCAFWSPLSAPKIITDKYWQLYPNPVNQFGSLHVQSEELIEGVLSVYDVSGKKMISTRVQLTRELDINLAGLPKGSYLLVIDNPNYSLKRLFIIN